MTLDLSEGNIVIITHGGRAFVCKTLGSVQTDIRFQKAANWEVLESRAVNAVESQGGSANTFLLSYYECPPDLAEQAMWHDG